MNRDGKDMGFGRKILGIVVMVGIVFFIMTTLNLNYFFHLDALLLVKIGTIGYALANSKELYLRYKKSYCRRYLLF